MDPSEEVEKELSNSIAQNSTRTRSKNHQKYVCDKSFRQFPHLLKFIPSI